MPRFEYNGDDACPKCQAVYAANGEGIPDYDEYLVTCLGCGYVGRIKEFMEEFHKLYPDFADSEVSDEQPKTRE